MKKQVDPNFFDSINSLYAQYAELALKKEDADFEAKYKAAYETVRSNIIIKVSELYFKFHYKIRKTVENDENNFSHVSEDEEFGQVNDESKNVEDYADVIVEQIVNSLESYENSTSKVNGCSFSLYVCRNVKQALGKAKSKHYASVNNGGSAITEHGAANIRKILKRDKDLEKLGYKDEDKRNEKLAMLFKTTVETIKKYKQLGKANTIADEHQDSEGNSYSVIDKNQTKRDEKYLSQENELFLKEIKNKLPELIAAMDSIYKKKPEERDSELLTVTILKKFANRREEEIENHDSLENFYPEVYELLKDYDYINKKMLTDFFENKDFRLPTMQEIANKYNVEKSAVTKFIQRFREKLLSDKKLVETFGHEDW